MPAASRGRSNTRPRLRADRDGIFERFRVVVRGLNFGLVTLMIADTDNFF